MLTILWLLKIWTYSHVFNSEICLVVGEWTPETTNMVWRPITHIFSSYRFPRSSPEDILGIRAKYGNSSQALELKPYQPDCCCTQSFRSWWDHYHGRFGAIDTAYKRIFEGCLLRRELNGEDRQILLEQIANDNMLSLIGKNNFVLSFRFLPPLPNRIRY